MDVSSVSNVVSPQSATVATPAVDSVVAADPGGIIGILKDSVEIQGDMAMKLIEAGLETSFAEDKMAIAQQIIDVYA